MKTENHLVNPRQLNIFINALILLLIFTFQNFAQNVQKQENTVDKSFKADLKVDPVTLGMSFSIPLGGYTGRNGMSIPITISYNSKLWKMEYGGYYQEGPCCAPSFTANPQGLPTENNYSWVNVMYAEDSVSGWNLRSIWVGETGDAPGYYDYNGNPGSPSENPDVDFYVDGVRIRMPDGSTHQFRKDDQTYALPMTPSYPKTYYSVDGTRMKYVKESATAATLYLPDGSRYVYGTNWGYYDRHGNKIGATDTLGRTINIPSLRTGFETGDQTYSLPGLNNTSRDYILRWRYLKNTTTGETVLSNPNDDLHPLGDSMPTGPVPQVNAPLFGSGGGSRVTPPSTHNPVVLAEVELPDGSKYKFRYNVYGEIDKVIYPTGSYEKFEYGEIPNIDPINEPYAQTNRGVKKRWVSENGTGNDEILTQYSASSGNGYSTTVTNPDGTKTVRIIQKGRGPGIIKYGFDDATAGSINEEIFYNSGNQIVRRTINSYIKEGAHGAGAEPTATRDARLEKQISIIIEPDSSTALMTQSVNEYDSQTDLEYFAYLNVKRVKEYGFVTVSKTTAENLSNNFAVFANYFNSQTPVRVMETDYLYDADYKARNMTSLPTETRILDGQNNVVAKSQIFYDQSAYLETASITNAPGWENPNTSVRGLPTTVRSWTDIANNQYVETHTLYDQFGNLRKVWDAKGNVSEIQYTDNYADNVNRNSYAFATRTISAIPDSSGTNGADEAFETTVKYDFNTGLPRFSTNADGQVSEVQYTAALLRPTKAIAPNGHQAITEYGVPDSSGQFPANQKFVKVKTQIDANLWKEGFSWFDGFGRTVKTQSIDLNGDVFTETEYDQMSRPKKTTNPYRTGETKYWTESFYDDLGRATKIKTPDNAQVLTSYGLAITGNQIGTVVTVTDQAGKQRRSITNALGQLMRVDEPNDGNQLGAIDAPNQPTNYTYDILNNLTTVSQGVQTRTFVYDSLSRLKSATNPESGTISYNYDNNGNLTQKTDARLVQTTYVYDNLNRVTNRNYSAPANLPNYQTTPNVAYTYDDPTVAFSKGKLTKVSSSVSETRYTQFDNVGRVLSSSQTTDGQTYSSSYVYNLSGALLEQTYPSGRVVKNTLDNDGDLQQVQSRKANDTFRNYANSFNYTAVGAVSSMRLGNGRWENTTFNSRLQPIQIGLGSSATNQGLLKLDYDYGTSDNNGNVKSQTITVPTVGANTGFTALQTYTYDSLNRIKDAKEMIGATQEWKQTFLYDRYGNRLFDEANTTTLQANCPTAVCNPQVDPTTNKLLGYTFDNTGNTSVDAENRTFIYDAENKQTEVKDAQNISIGQYFYDASGNRVKKYVPSTNETTIFVYDASDRLVTEHSTIIATPTEAKVSYLTNDHLGSPRINTDTNGQIIARHDYQPFGEEIQRTSYGADTVRQKFTSYERDIETNLDFAQARYFNSGIGRFSSPDYFVNDTHVSDPQSWNLYGYVRNNPLNLTDPLGKEAEVTSTYDAATNTTKIRIRASFAIYGATGQNVSKEELERQKKNLTKGILAAWNNQSRTIDGRNYEITTEITVQTAGSEEEAIATGASNLVEIGTQPLYDTRDGERLRAQVFRRDGENFDRLRISISGDEPMYGYEGVYAHEFGHLLGPPDQLIGLFSNSIPTRSLIEKDIITLFSEKQVTSNDAEGDSIRVKTKDPNDFLKNSTRPVTSLTRMDGSKILSSKINTYEVRQTGGREESSWVKMVKK